MVIFCDVEVYEDTEGGKERRKEGGMKGWKEDYSEGDKKRK